MEQNKKLMFVQKMTTIFPVKCWTEYFNEIKAGNKTHDLRRMDRDYKVDDILLLEEYDHIKGYHTGKSVSARISYITSVKTPCALSTEGLKEDFCILSIKLI